MAKKTPDTKFLKVAFREAVFGFEIVRDYKADETQVLCSVEYLLDRFVYVFTTDPGDSSRYKFFQEYYGLDKGAFAICTPDDFGKDERNQSNYSEDYVWIPGVVGEKELEIYACLSQVQLPWGRIKEIEKDPAKRCYQLGAKKGGLCWLPNGVERVMQGIAGTSDSRLTDPGDDTVLMGLYDHLREAERRQEQFGKKLDDYLQSRFDADANRHTNDSKNRLRMLKYTASLINNLVNGQHKHAAKYKAALANGGQDLQRTLKNLREKELHLRQEAEQAAYSVVRWLDDPDGTFEGVLADYTSTDYDQDKWDKIQDRYCSLLDRFHEMSVTRKYLHAKWGDPESWMKKYLLNESAFQGVRKTTEATVKFFDAISSIAVRFENVDEVVVTYESIYRVWFKGIRFEKVAKDPFAGAEIRFRSLARTPDQLTVQSIRVSPQAQSLERLGKVANSGVVKGVSIAIEGVNLALSVDSLINSTTEGGSVKWEMVDTAGGILDLVLATNELIKFLGDRQAFALGFVSGAIDSVIAAKDGNDEWGDKDYDAAVARYTVAVGAAMGAASQGLMLASTFGFVALGASTGGVLLVAGALVVATGTVAYYLSDDSAIETFIKECEWGNNAKWSFFSAPDFEKKVERLNSLVMSFACTVSYDPLKKAASIHVKTNHLRACSTIRVNSLQLHDDAGRSEAIVASPVTLSEVNSNSISGVEFYKDDTLNVVCSFKHVPRLEKVSEITSAVQIDLMGNGSILLPRAGQAQVSSGRVFWG